MHRPQKIAPYLWENGPKLHMIFQLVQQNDYDRLVDALRQNYITKLHTLKAELTIENSNLDMVWLRISIISTLWHFVSMVPILIYLTEQP